MASKTAPLKEAAKAVKSLEKLLKKWLPDKAPTIGPDGKKIPTPLPTGRKTKERRGREPAEGLLKFAEAVKAVDSVLLEGFFDADNPEEYLAELAEFLFDADNEEQADIIYEKMRRKILPRSSRRAYVDPPKPFLKRLGRKTRSRAENS